MKHKQTIYCEYIDIGLSSAKSLTLLSFNFASSLAVYEIHVLLFPKSYLLL